MKESMASIWEEKEKIREDRLKIPRANFDISFISVENDGSLGKIFFFLFPFSMEMRVTRAAR